MPTTVDFAAGEALKEVKIAFDIAVGTTASYTMAIPEEESYVYGSPKVTVNIKRDYTWLNIGTDVYKRQILRWPVITFIILLSINGSILLMYKGREI